MPSLMIHYKAAVFLAEAKPHLAAPAFYLGCLVPDAVNADGFAEKETRWKAHLRDKDLNKWADNVERFVKKNRGQVEEGYLFGYACHCLTDILWDEKNETRVQKRLARAGVRQEKLHAAAREDYARFDALGENRRWFGERVAVPLAAAKPRAINHIDAPTILRYRRQVIKNLSGGPALEKPRVLTGQMVGDFSAALLERLAQSAVLAPFLEPWA